MAPSEPSSSTIPKLKHPYTEEAEENQFKNNFMKLIEDFKEEVKNSFKEIEKKQKVLEEINKSLNEIKKTKIKNSNR